MVMLDKKIQILPLEKGAEIPFGLLELADPSREQIESYVYDGYCYIAVKEGERIGVMVLKEVAPQVLEIKNIAINPAMQGKGYGRQLLKKATELALISKNVKVIIATGNSSIGQLALYQKEGFEITQIDKNFFTKNYPEPIWENGILCKHKIILEKALR